MKKKEIYNYDTKSMKNIISYYNVNCNHSKYPPDAKIKYPELPNGWYWLGSDICPEKHVGTIPVGHFCRSQHLHGPKFSAEKTFTLVKQYYKKLKKAGHISNYKNICFN